MQYKITTYSISDIVEGLSSKKFRINHDYQRNPGLWPKSAKSYFIDTILEKFPFPPIHVFQNFDRDSNKTYLEIIDGQQRVTTILDFYKDKFKLTKESNEYSGKLFSELSEDIKEEFLRYPVDSLLILSGSRSEILEMFRRMNAYTVPLNGAEKRNAMYQGAFRWFINDISERYSSFHEEFGVFTPKQILRQLDTELLTELCLSIENGIIAKDPKKISGLYKKYDREFTDPDRFEERVGEFYDFAISALSSLKNSKILQYNNFHDIFIAVTHLKYNLPNVEQQTGITPQGDYCGNIDAAIAGLQKLTDCIEMESEEPWVEEFVKASKRSTTKQPERIKKVEFYLRALRGEFA